MSKCNGCKDQSSSTPCDNPGIRRRQNTAYVDEESNYNVFCESCQVEADAYWDEMWQEYWNGIL